MNYCSPGPRRANALFTVWMLIAVAAALVLAQGTGLAGTDSARECLKKGGIVIDVRSAGEFQEKHLPAAINIPLDRLGDEVARRYPDKKQPLLLHCLSGGRSAKGAALLKKMGYQNVINLGSYASAEQITKPQ